MSGKPHLQNRSRWRQCLLLGLLALWAAPGFAQNPQQGVVNFNGRAFVLNGGFVYPAPVQTSEPAVPATGDLLRFADGSELHGTLTAIEPGHTVVWSHPDASRPISFRADNLDLIRFSQAKSVPLAPQSRIRFVNGDEIPADITSMDWEKISVTTWFSGAATIPRTAIQSITFLPKGYASGYEGPLDTKGWVIMSPGSWRYRDGVFTSRGAGSLGRDLQLSGSCTVEFDLASPISYHLLMGLYIEKDQVDYGNDLYLIELTSGTVRIRRNNPALGPTDLGSASLPAPVRKNRVHLAFQCNQSEKTLTLLADDQLVRRWKDETGFVGKGSRFAISDLSMAAGVSLSDFRVSRWEGREPNIISTPQTNSDAIWLANRDRAMGKITGMGEGKVNFLLAGHQIEIPLDRVTKLEFAAAAPVTLPPHEMRAVLPGGTRLLLDVDKWSTNEVSARSACLGAVVLKPGMIRELDFNPGRTAEPETAMDDFGGMDD